MSASCGCFPIPLSSCGNLRTADEFLIIPGSARIFGSKFVSFVPTTTYGFGSYLVDNLFFRSCFKRTLSPLYVGRSCTSFLVWILFHLCFLTTIALENGRVNKVGQGNRQSSGVQRREFGTYFSAKQKYSG